MNPIEQAIEALLTGAAMCAEGTSMRKEIEDALTSLRSLQKEVEGALPKADFFFEGGSTPCWYESSVRTAVAAALGRGAVPQDGRPALQLADLILSMDLATEKGQRARDLARQVQEQWHESPAEDALRAIASYLGVGGYNAPYVDAATYQAKIIEEIGRLSAAPTPEATQPGPMEKLTRLQEDMRLYDDSWPDAPASGFGPKLMPQVSGFNQPTQAEAPSERAKAIMEQAQVFASAWSLVGGRFDSGSGLEDAEREKAELERMVRAALATQQAVQGEPVPQGWTPTPENINALPAPLRNYIAALETNADPAGTVRDLAIARDTLRALEASNRMLRDASKEHPTEKDVSK